MENKLTEDINYLGNEMPVPKWFKGIIYDKGDTVRNRFSGESYKLNNVELSIYDFIIGCSTVIEMGMFDSQKHLDDMRKGLDWFRRNNIEAYYVLLD